MYSLMERKRLRLKYNKVKEVVDVPNLLQSQVESYQGFLEASDNQLSGIDRAFRAVFPIEGHTKRASIEYDGYSLDIDNPPYTIDECRKYGSSYVAPLYARLRLVIKNKEDGFATIKEQKEQEVYIGDIHLMTPVGSFIVNGTERVVVSQLHRSPGVFFNYTKGNASNADKVFYSARIIPYNGSWLDIEFNNKDQVYACIDRRYKVPINYLFCALGISNEEILDHFFEKDLIHIREDRLFLNLISDHIKDQVASFDIKDNQGKVVVEEGHRITTLHAQELEGSGVVELEIPPKYIYGKVLAEDISKDGEVVIACNTKIDKDILAKIKKIGVTSFKTIYTNDVNKGSYISDTMRDFPISNQLDAIKDIYSRMRPAEQVSEEIARTFFDNLFFTQERYNLSPVGRMKFNKRLKRDKLEGSMTLTKEDIVDTVKTLMDIRNGLSDVDDIDSLGNRRIKQVGEMVENYLKIGLLRIERAVRERLSLAEVEKQTPKELISAKAVSAAVREFFTGSQLSQLVDQVNPLAEITHKRRVSALGPGGLSRERAGFEVRDVHPTHYGRLCPIETPEGPNIGLISSMAIYARIDSYGFLETPYRRVSKKKVTDEVTYLSAMDEWDQVIANEMGNGLGQDMVPVRNKNEVTLKPAKEITLMDVSPQQLISVAASLIPFLEHDDANRALMGSNMQRQAVPLMKKQKPLVGTGMEKYVARDSGSSVVAKRDGIVEKVDSNKIVVRVTESTEDLPVDIYPLVKFRRSNQNTCINQAPSVKVGDRVERQDILADGAATDTGELALGTNLRVGLMCWKGYNFEDSILLSERLVTDQNLTSVHIMEFSCTARVTKLGDEEITQDIPNVSEVALSSLDEVGIVHIGARVQTGDILVGMVTPKGEDQFTPEEKLLRAIFGEKASNVKDSSLRVPPGVKGTVVDVQVFTREGLEKDSRAKAIDKEELEGVQKDLDTQYQISSSVTATQLRERLVGKPVIKAKKLKADQKLTKDYLNDCSLEELFALNMKNAQLNDMLDRAREVLAGVKKNLDKEYKRQEKKIQSGEGGLPPGVLKMVKVFIAVKRHIQPGDKMAGRHGNKGVVSAIMPVEDMPHDENGEPIDVVLSPLGLPSRMNIGQLLEAHLGFAAKKLGDKITELIEREKNLSAVADLLKKVYASMDDGGAVKYIESLDKKQLEDFSLSLREGIPITTPVFDGVKEGDIDRLLDLADVAKTEKMLLYDGRTGESFEQKVTVGHMYLLKLNHLVDDKMHARSIGSYGLVTQQPLGGKAQMGGQRFGEMEVWALEAYGAAYTLREMLTVKSDDIEGRKQVYKNIIDGKSLLQTHVPESFNVLVKEIRSLALNMDYSR